MSPIQSSLQKIFVECLEAMLRPLVRLTLYCGLGYAEFSAAIRRVFIDVATEEYGIRGRPANVAKISAKTGISRKVIQRHRTRSDAPEWTPDDEISPLNTIIHYWRFDERFCVSPGEPRDLSQEGDNSFATLVKEWVGDIPTSTIRQDLLREEIATVNENGLISLRLDYSFPERLDEDFLRNAAFSIQHLGETLFYNATLIDSGHISPADHLERGRFERFAWSRRLDKKAADSLQLWVRREGEKFILRADEFMSQLESSRSSDSQNTSNLGGVGMYFFRQT